jgi:hypothetical protein
VVPAGQGVVPAALAAIVVLVVVGVAVDAVLVGLVVRLRVAVAETAKLDTSW